MKRMLFGIAAQNNAGKSTALNALTEIGCIPYSVRTLIQDRYKRIHNEDLPTTRDALQHFAQKQKSLDGPETFIKEAVDDFYHNQTAQFGIIESFRAPGEPLWFLIPPLKYVHLHTRVLGITAPKQDRLRRFLKNNRPDELGKTRTPEEFEHQEILVNKGETDWEENVEKVLKHACKIFDNADGKREQMINEITFFVNSYK